MTTKELTTKELILLAMADLPEDATYEDAMDVILLLYKIQRGIEEADAGHTISNDEAKERMRKWLQ
jgi:hypothetical protein